MQYSPETELLDISHSQFMDTVYGSTLRNLMDKFEY